mmetsp:Transcript_4407/g.8589  ORF Transcript_4407/g.8589 Transcript_4407/m.8589 type:complete len:84 (-) Transcript_4407:483-734(-)
MGDGDTPTPMVAKPAKTTKKAIASRPYADMVPETILPIRAQAQCDYRSLPQCIPAFVDVTPEAPSLPITTEFNPAAAVKHTSV